MHLFAEIISWFKIFLSPVLLALMICVILYAGFDRITPSMALIAVAGGAAGILLAEYIRRKWGCHDFLTRQSYTNKEDEEDKI